MALFLVQSFHDFRSHDQVRAFTLLLILFHPRYNRQETVLFMFFRAASSLAPIGWLYTAAVIEDYIINLSLASAMNWLMASSFPFLEVGRFVIDGAIVAQQIVDVLDDHLHGRVIGTANHEGVTNGLPTGSAAFQIGDVLEASA